MRIRLLGFFLCLLFCGQFALAQGTTGAISGTVKDSTGAVLSGAKVVILNEDTGISRTVQTDSAGRYSAPSLSLGNYRVSASLEGFQTAARRGLLLTVGREAVVDFELAVGAVTQTVEVTGEVPLVESTTSSLGSLVDERTIRDLPLNGRSYDQLALLQPGVIALGGGTGGSFQYGTSKRFSVAGSRSDANAFMLDGTDINDQASGSPGGAAGTNLGVDTIREFKILTNAFSAEYGRAAGAVITAVTRSGTNEWHGSIFEFIRNSRLDARNFFDVGAAPPPFRRNQFGGVFGGPIKRDKTFFFGGYEGLRQGLGTTLIAFVPTVRAKQGILPTGTVAVDSRVVPFLNLYPAPNGREFGDGTGEFNSSSTAVTREDYFMVRVDHQLDGKNSIFGRYSFDDDSQNVPENIPIFVDTFSSRRQYTTLQINSILSPTLLNHFHFAYNRSFPANDTTIVPALGPEFSFVPGQAMGSMQVGPVQGVASTRSLTPLGLGSAIPRVYYYHLFEWSEDFSYMKGRHAWKMGASARRIRNNSALNTNLRGVYTFNTFNDLLAARPSVFNAVQVGQDAYRGFRQTLFGAYVQDDFSVNTRLTLNLGLRWEAMTDPTEVNGKASILLSPSDPQTTVGRFYRAGKKNIEPRAGFAWRLNDKGTTVLRAAGGIFHRHVLPADYSVNIPKLPPFYILSNVNNPSFPDGYRQLGIGAAAPQIFTLNPRLKSLAKYQYNLSLQQQLFRDQVIEVAYVGAQTRHILYFAEQNTPIPTRLPDGRRFFPAGAPRANPNFSVIRVQSSEADADYNGLTITLRRKSSAGLQYQAFYTFSKALDHKSGIATGDERRDAATLLDPLDRGRDWGLSSFDARHNFVFNLTYPLPFRFDSKALAEVLGGWSLSGIGTFTAGQAFTPRLGSNNSRNGDQLTPDRPDLKPGASNNPTEGATAGCGLIPAGQKLSTPDRWYDPCAFQLPLPGTYGDLGRNTVIGPGVATLDLSIEKTFPLLERADVVFRAEMFNIINHANFGLPAPTVLTATGAPSGNAGRITETLGSSRQIQFGLKINF